MALDLGISLKVETSSLEDAMKKVNALGDAVNKVSKEISSSSTRTSKSTQESNKAIERSSDAVEKSTKKITSVLERQRLIAQFLAGDFTKGEASILATGKAAGLTNKQMKELEGTLKQIFKLSGKNPFDDSVDPLRRLTAESEKLVNKMKVLRGETSLTAKQLEELNIRQARIEATARANGLRGAALQSTINKATREYISLSEKVNSQQSQYNIELEKTKQKRKDEESVFRGISTGISGAIKQQEKLKKLVEETELKSRLMQQGLSTTTANMVARAVRGGASETGSEVSSLIASRKAIESVNEAKKKLNETSSATYQAIVEGNKKAKFHIDGLQAAVRAVIPGFGALSAVAIGSTVIAGAIRMADAYTSLQSRIKLTGITSEQLQVVNEKLLGISNESRTSLAENTQLYVKLANALKNFGGTSVDALNVTSAFSKALVIGGANTREASAATLQFAQALGSGKLAGDEFRSIAEASPRVLKAIADGSGIAADKLKKMSSEGMLTTSLVAKALVSQLAVLEAEMLTLAPTIGQAFQVLTNNTTSLIGKLNEATGFTKGVADGILGIANSIPTADSVIKNITDSVRGFGKILQDNKDLVGGFVGSIITVAAPFAIMKAATIGSTLAFAGLSATLKITTAVMAGYRGVMLAVALAGGGLTGVIKLLNAAMMLLVKNPIGLALTAIGTGLAYAFSDQISSMIQKVTDKLTGFNSEVEKSEGVGSRLLSGNELQKKLQEIQAENIKTKKLLGVDLSKEEKSSEKKSEIQGYTDIREFVKEQMNLLSKRKDLSQEQYETEARSIVALAEQLKLKQELAKVSLTESKEDKKGIFNLANINRLYETEIQQSNKLFDFRRDLIDKNLQYDLVTAGVAEIQKQRLAEETYKREKELLEKQRQEVKSLSPNAKLGSEQYDTQKEAIETQKKVLDEKIKTLDIDRQRTVEIAKVVSLGESEKKALEARRDIAKIEADIREDISRKQQEFNARFSDPAVLAGEQARLQAADKYTQKIADAQSELQRVNKAVLSVLNDEELLNQVSNDRAAIQARINELLLEQSVNSEKVRKSEEDRVNQSRSLEDGFKSAFKTYRDESNDLSKISRDFTQGFFREFDTAFINIFKSGKLQFGNLFRFIREEIKKLLIQKTFLEPIKIALEGVFSQLGKFLLSGITSLGTSLISTVGAGVAAAMKFNIADSIGNAALSATASSPMLNTGVSQTIKFINKANTSISSSFEGVGKSLSLMVDDFASYLTTTNSQVLQNIGIQIQNAQTGANSVGGAGSVGGVVGGFAGAYFGGKVGNKLSGGRTIGGLGGTVNSLLPTIGAAVGQAVGAALGSVIPVIGTTIGSAVGGFLGGIAGGIASGIQRQIFGKKVTQTSGIEGTISSEGFSGKSFLETVTKRRLRSTKVNTQYSDLERDYENTLDDTIALTFQGSREILKILGAGSESAINSYRESGRYFIRSTEELKSTLLRLSNTLLDRALPSLKQFQREGESLAQTAMRVANTIQGLNNLTQLLGNASKFAYSTFGAGEDLAKSLQNEDFQKALEFYVQNFADKADVFKAKAEAFNFQVQQLGFSLQDISSTSTKEDFTAIVKGLDLTTKSGQELLGKLLSLSPALKELTDLRLNEQAAIQKSVSTVQKLIDSVQGVNDPLFEASKSITELKIALFSTQDVDTRLNLETQLAEQISSRYQLEFEMLDTLKNNISELTSDIKNQRSSVAADISKILGTPLQKNAAQISEEVLSASSNVNLPGLDAIRKANDKVADFEARLVEVGKAKVQLPSAENIFSNLVSDAKRVISEIDVGFKSVGVLALTGTQQRTIPEVNAALDRLGSGVGEAIRFNESTNRIINEKASLGARGFDLGSRFNAARAFEDAVSSFGGELLKRRDIIQSVGNLRIKQAEEKVSALRGVVSTEPSVVKSLEDAQKEQAAAKKSFADAIQQFVVDAGKAVTKLSKLREETVSYFEAQQALANLYKSTASSIRSTIAGARFQSTPQAENLARLQSQFGSAVALSKTLTGNALIEQAGKIEGLIDPILKLALELSPSSVSFSLLEAAILSQAETVASRLDSIAPRDFQQESVALLLQIDTQLALIEGNTSSAEKLVVDAINASKDSTLNGLRGVISAIRGEPVQAFASGASFTNGVVTRPTFFNSSVMGEAGSEAIMPLTNVNGSLGVRAISGNNSELVKELKELRNEVRQLRSEQRTGMGAIASNTMKTANLLDDVTTGSERFVTVVEAM